MPSPTDYPSLLRGKPYVLLDDSRRSGAGRSLLLADGLLGEGSLLEGGLAEIIRADRVEDIGPALERLDQVVAAGATAAGFIAYETAAFFEPSLQGQIKPLPAGQPYLWFMVSDNPVWLSSADVVQMFKTAEAGNQRHPSAQVQEPDGLEDAYAGQFAATEALIEAGDVYQINLTYETAVTLAGDPIAFFERMRAAQPVPYGALIETGDQTILSASPELFMRNDRGRLQARPMKGTAPRHAQADQDQAEATNLLTSEKGRAENLMIVDLLRNDLSRIAKPSSVCVPDLFTLEPYKSVWQMTSTIEAEAVDDLMPSQALAALFPCGSVTGAPKIRAMQIIADLESRPRGVYCGAIGFFSGLGAQADWCLNVPIRTLVLDSPYARDDQGDVKRAGRFALGSGLVADSICTEELAECRLKGRFLERCSADSLAQHHLIETMRRESDGSIPLLAGHMARLRKSAAALGFPFDRQVIDEALDQHVFRQDPAENGAGCSAPVWRLRLTLDHQGSVVLESVPFDASDSDKILRLGVSVEPVHSGDPARQVKSSDRRLYTDGLARAKAAGLDDLIYLNEHGEIAETAIHTLYLECADGTWLTPPVESGALPGVKRAALLAASPHMVEKRITLDDISAAHTLWCSNAVHGLRQAVLADRQPR